VRGGDEMEHMPFRVVFKDERIATLEIKQATGCAVNEHNICKVSTGDTNVLIDWAAVLYAGYVKDLDK
jgi:hypothetical protein